MSARGPETPSNTAEAPTSTQEVRQTVSNTTQAANNAVGGAVEYVKETVENVKEALSENMFGEQQEAVEKKEQTIRRAPRKMIQPILPETLRRSLPLVKGLTPQPSILTYQSMVFDPSKMSLPTVLLTMTELQGKRNKRGRHTSLCLCAR